MNMRARACPSVRPSPQAIKIKLPPNCVLKVSTNLLTNDATQGLVSDRSLLFKRSIEQRQW